MHDHERGHWSDPLRGLCRLFAVAQAHVSSPAAADQCLNSFTLTVHHRTHRVVLLLLLSSFPPVTRLYYPLSLTESTLILRCAFLQLPCLKSTSPSRLLSRFILVPVFHSSTSIAIQTELTTLTWRLATAYLADGPRTPSDHRSVRIRSCPSPPPKDLVITWDDSVDPHRPIACSGHD